MKIEGNEEREKESHRILRRRIDAIFVVDGSWKYLWMAEPRPSLKSLALKRKGGPLNAKIG